MRSIILVPKLSCSRIAYRTISRHFRPWALAQYRTRRAYKSPTYPRPIMIPSRAVLFHSERPSPPTPLSYPPSTDADDDPSATSPSPSPASSAREHSILVVFSSEVPSNDVTLLPLANSELALGRRERAGASARLCVLIFPVLGLLPALFGLHIVTYVLCELAGRPLERPLPVRHRKSFTNGCRRTCCIASRASRVNRSSTHTSLLLSEYALPLLTESHYIVCSC
jgi:hypothetical protein